jgi:hypothetical protein
MSREAKSSSSAEVADESVSKTHPRSIVSPGNAATCALTSTTRPHARWALTASERLFGDEPSIALAVEVSRARRRPRHCSTRASEGPASSPTRRTASVSGRNGPGVVVVLVDILLVDVVA